MEMEGRQEISLESTETGKSQRWVSGEQWHLDGKEESGFLKERAGFFVVVAD